MWTYTILQRTSPDSANEVMVCDNYMSAMDQLLLAGEGHFCETPDGQWIHAVTFERETPTDDTRARLMRKPLRQFTI